MNKIIRDIVIISLFLSLVGWDQLFVPGNTKEIQEKVKEINGSKNVPPEEFYTDGCSLWLDSFLKYSWQEECIEHDIKYWAGGTEEERLEADLKLRDDVNKIVPGMGDILYVGVRAGGRNLIPMIPYPWGWGYGWDGNKATSSNLEE